MTESSLVNLGELTKPATVLIEKVSDAIGGICKPWQIERVAKAEGKADIIRAESQIRIAGLHERAMRRFVGEEAKKQSNIEGITVKALAHLREDSAPQDVEDDWITNFFDKCRIISDDDMQKLWSQVLAGEANSPGAFSKRTVNLLADLDKSDAELFAQLCGFVWTLGELTPLVYDVRHEVYNSHGLDFNTLSHLGSLGFVRFDNLGAFQRLELPKRLTALYYDRPVELTFPKDTGNRLGLGKLLLTRAGQELAYVCGSKPVDGFFEFVYDRWASEGLVPKRETEQDTAADEDSSPS